MIPPVYEQSNKYGGKVPAQAGEGVCNVVHHYDLEGGTEATTKMSTKHCYQFYG